MKIEFKQKQVEQLPLENLTEDQFLTIALETSNRLGWVLGDKNQKGLSLTQAPEYSHGMQK